MTAEATSGVIRPGPHQVHPKIAGREPAKIPDPGRAELSNARIRAPAMGAELSIARLGRG